MNIKVAYNKIANDWHAEHRSDRWWVEGMEKFISLFKNGDLILDAGCAGGIKSKYFIEKGLAVVGIDISENFIDIAKREVPEGKFKVMDISDVSSLKADFDGIFLQAVLLHVTKKDAFSVVKGLYEKLKKGGYFYITVKEVRPGQPEEEVKVDDDYGYEYERFFSYYTMQELKKYFEDLNLAVVYESAILSGRTVWLQIIGKKL